MSARMLMSALGRRQLPSLNSCAPCACRGLQLLGVIGGPRRSHINKSSVDIQGDAESGP